MLSEITMGLSSLKAASDILKGLNAVNTKTLINDVKLPLQEHILGAQQALAAAQETQATLTQRIRDLEQEIVHLKDWECEKQRYQLQAIDVGVFAYMPKPGMENGEPPHWLCANCFNRGQKAFLQFKGRDRRPIGGRGEHSNYGCDICNASVKVFYRRNPQTSWSSQGDSSPAQSVKGLGEVCPKCGEAELRLDRSEPDHIFAAVGGARHIMKCGACGFEEGRLVQA